MSAPFTTRTSCRACGSSDLADLFSLGDQFVSDFVRGCPVSYQHLPHDSCDGTPWKDPVKVPIDIVLCQSCTLVQQRHTAPQDFLYTRHYWYVSGTTQTMRNALADVARAAEQAVGGLNPGDVVLDIGSNDGTLLRAYDCEELVRIGVEPANNLATKENYPKGGPYWLCVMKDFWSAGAYWAWLEKMHVANGLPASYKPKPKIITAIGVFYDLEDPNAFIADVAKVLAPDGVFVAQLMCLKQTVALGDVGNFVHEHLEFWSLESLKRIFGRHGLEIFRLEENRVNGGSYRIFARHEVRGKDWSSRVGRRVENLGSIMAAEEQEREMGLARPDTYKSFFNRLLYERKRCVSFVERVVGEGKKVFVLGASTKGNAVLQWLGLDHRWIEGASDRSPEKWGKFTVGTGIPICSEEEARKAKPDFFLCLPYAFRDEMMEREREWAANGSGKFLFVCPQFEVV